jgi:hypothetical protein
MYFAIDADHGHTIAGWLVLDNPSIVPEITIRIPGREQITFKANVLRPDLKDHGLHSTGLAGFQIDGSMVDDIANVPQITLFETESNLPIFRRNAYGAAIEKKFFLMEIGALPQIKLLREAMQQFDLSYPAVERFPLETTTSIIGSHSRSVFLSGRPNWQRHGSLMREKGFITTALLRNPFDELAERLLTLSQMRRWSEGASTNPFMKHHAILLQIIDKMDFDNEKSLLAAFRGLSAEQYNLLRSPMTAAFGCLPEEEVQRRNVSTALDNLAFFDLVGTRENIAEFSILADGLLETSLFSQITLDMMPGVPQLSAILSKIGMIADILDEDVALYSFASQAVKEALAGHMKRDAANQGRLEDASER